MLTVRKKRRGSSPRGDYITLCDYCGVCWPRHLLKMDRGGLLYCRDEGDGLSSTALSEGNAANSDREVRTPPRMGGNACITNPFGTAQHICDIDTSTPEALSIVPADNSVNVSANTQLTIVFNKQIRRGQGDIQVIRLSDDVVFETIDVYDEQVAIQGDTVTITLSSPLADATAYYVNIDEGAFVDCNLVSFAGYQDNTSWDFTTADTGNPVLISSVPADGTTDYCYNLDITLTFNEDVQPGAGTVFIKRFADDTVFESFAVGSLSFVDHVVTINPSTDLENFTQYYVEIAAGVIEDTAGNPYAGLVKGDLDFTTPDNTPVEFTATGDEPLSVPTWATSAQVKLRGGGGGGGGGGDEPGGIGGGAGAADVTFEIGATTSLTIRVGGGAAAGSGSGGGGQGGGGGGGGGASAVFAGGAIAANRVAVAAGGGGGSGGDDSATGPGVAGGPGGNSIGNAGANAGTANGGSPGTQAVGGAGGSGENSGSAGALFLGGAGADGPGVAPAILGGSGGFGGGADGGDGYFLAGGGGGGSGGYYGGGGGGSSSGALENTGAGGGSGSGSALGYVNVLEGGSGTAPGLPLDADLGSTGTGGSGGAIGAAGTDGSDGKVWVQFGCESAP